MEECCHLLTYRRCGGSGHVAANCQMLMVSASRRKKTRSRPTNHHSSTSGPGQQDFLSS